MPHTQEELEKMRQWVQNWKVVGPIMEQMRAEDLQAMTLQQAQKDVLEAFRMADGWMAQNPGYERECGMIEQQRIFSRWNHSKV